MIAHRKQSLLVIVVFVSALLFSLLLQAPIRPALAYTGVVTAANSITGATYWDGIGLRGVYELPNGNIVIASPGWQQARGAVTCLTPAQYKAGGVVVSAANSLVGRVPNDLVGNGGVTVLTNGNYVVSSPQWNGDSGLAVGAVTWGKSDCSLIGTVLPANSLIGTTTADVVGFDGVTALTNGNYVVKSKYWHNGGADAAGAATWANGTTGIVGVVSSANSLVGTAKNDQVSSDGVLALSNGNYVVVSNGWNMRSGAVTWGSGINGVSGVVSAANSLVAYTDGVFALTNGNYVVCSSNWNGGFGAVTWVNGVIGLSGTISPVSSLVGSSPVDQVGSGGATALTNGNYVIKSPDWNGMRGAATWGNGATGSVGVVAASNSLVGSTNTDKVGTKVTALNNGNYVVGSTDWNGMRGAATWGSGTTGAVGVVSAANSLVGTTLNDQIGTIITPLVNGNYVVSSPNWDGSGSPNAGAVTWGNGITGLIGVVSSANSLIGAAQDDRIGINGAVALTNGNYVVQSPNWNGMRGAATWANGSTGLIGTVSAANSLVGTTANDRVSYEGVTALTNGNYVVASGSWHNGSPVGAATWGNGVTGIAGPVSSANSLIGNESMDYVAVGGVTALRNGNYVVNSPNKKPGGAMTWGNGATGTAGIVSTSNSLIAATDGDFSNASVVPLADGNYLAVMPYWDKNGLTDAGAVVYGTPSTLTFPVDTIGVYDNGIFYLRNSNTAGPADQTVAFNPYNVPMSKLLPVVGDWNGDGVDTVGIYDVSVGVFILSDSNTAPAQSYALVMGNPGDEPLAGHWDATMTGDSVGVYRPSNGLLYVKRTLTTGYADYTMVLGNPGDHGIAGDWDGNGFDSVGVYRPVNTMFYLANALGGTTQLPAIIFSDYNFVFGPANLTPIAGDWTGSGIAHVGYVLNGTFNLKYTHTAGAADNTFAFGSVGAKPVAGHWIASSSPSVPSILVTQPPAIQTNVPPTLKPSAAPNGGGLFD